MLGSVKLMRFIRFVVFMTSVFWRIPTHVPWHHGRILWRMILMMMMMVMLSMMRMMMMMVMVAINPMELVEEWTTVIRSMVSIFIKQSHMINLKKIIQKNKHFRGRCKIKKKLK